MLISLLTYSNSFRICSIMFFTVSETLILNSAVQRFLTLAASLQYTLAGPMPRIFKSKGMKSTTCKSSGKTWVFSGQLWKRGPFKSVKFENFKNRSDAITKAKIYQSKRFEKQKVRLSIFLNLTLQVTEAWLSEDFFQGGVNNGFFQERPTNFLLCFYEISFYQLEREKCFSIKTLTWKYQISKSRRESRPFPTPMNWISKIHVSECRHEQKTQFFD